MRYVFMVIFFITISRVAIAETYLFVGTTFPIILEQKPNGKVYGLGHDIAKEIAHRLGHDIKIEMYPFKRALKMVEHGEADVFIGPYKSAERQKFMNYSKYAFYQDPMLFYTTSENTFTWDGNLSSLEGMHIGTTRGWSYGTEFDQYKQNLSVETVGTVRANFQKLLAGRIDLLISHPRSALTLIDDLNIHNKVKMILPPIIINKGYYGFSRERDLNDFLTQFDLEFKKMIDSGEISKISRKYDLNFENIVQE